MKVISINPRCTPPKWTQLPADSCLRVAHPHDRHDRHRRSLHHRRHDADLNMERRGDSHCDCPTATSDWWWFIILDGYIFWADKQHPLAFFTAIAFEMNHNCFHMKVSKIGGTPIAGWFIREILNKNGWLGEPLFQATSTYFRLHTLLSPSK